MQNVQKKQHYVPVNTHNTVQKSKMISLQSCLMSTIKYLAPKISKIIHQIIKKFLILEAECLRLLENKLKNKNEKYSRYNRVRWVKSNIWPENFVQFFIILAKKLCIYALESFIKRAELAVRPFKYPKLKEFSLQRQITASFWCLFLLVFF